MGIWVARQIKVFWFDFVRFLKSVWFHESHITSTWSAILLQILKPACKLINFYMTNRTHYSVTKIHGSVFPNWLCSAGVPQGSILFSVFANDVVESISYVSYYEIALLKRFVFRVKMLLVGLGCTLYNMYFFSKWKFCVKA